MPALPSCLLEPIGQQVQALIPEPVDDHPWGCHRPRVPDRVVFELLVNALVFGAGYRRIADQRCSATTLRRRRDEWVAAGVMSQVQRIARAGYDRMIGLALDDIAVDGCLTNAPCGGEVAGRNPTDRGNLGLKRSTLVDAAGTPLGVLTAPANRHDSPLLAPTAPIQVGKRWVVERTNAWHNSFTRLTRCTERRQAITDFYVSLANTVIILRRLLRQAWTLYRWNTRPARRP